MAIDVEDFYRRFGPMVLRRCRKLLRSEEDAVDAMQDTFVQVLRRAERLDDSAPSSLLYRTATNVCLNMLRSKRRKPESPGEELLLRIATLENDEKKAEARSILGRLFSKEKESTATIAVLHLVDGLTLEQTANEVGLSVSGVRLRLRQLKARLGEMEGRAS
ncbi:MAG: sigma-70 family RNA polymerase sigma factor [Myxococcota bacterium]